MKKVVFSAFTIGAILFTACNNSNTKKENDGNDMDKMATDSTKDAGKPDDKEVKTIAVTYNNIDSKLAASISTIADEYLQVKNALANDNSADAVTGAKAITASISKMDKSLFKAEQKLAFDKSEEKLKENAAGIAMNTGKIKEQRLQFAAMSEGMYELAKNFSTGRTLYHDHCPMARGNQGAMWLSEVKEVKNPYLGAEMPTCGTVMEIIK